MVMFEIWLIRPHLPTLPGGLAATRAVRLRLTDNAITPTRLRRRWFIFKRAVWAHARRSRKDHFSLPVRRSLTALSAA